MHGQLPMPSRRGRQLTKGIAPSIEADPIEINGTACFAEAKQMVENPLDLGVPASK